VKRAFEVIFGHVLFTGWMVAVWQSLEMVATGDSVLDFLGAFLLYWSIPGGIILVAYFTPPRAPGG